MPAHIHIYLPDITCDEPAPHIPTDPEYTLPSYDGTVVVTSLAYPSLQRTQAKFYSNKSSSELARNYLANLTYSCGGARQFFQDGTSTGQEQSTTCLWDKSWSPTHQLGECDWVACLKPPNPPASTNLRVTDWHGQPVLFGDMVHFVCDRGTYFEDDPTQVEVTFTCQDGSGGTNRGFFDIPEEDKEWPRCLQGQIFVFKDILPCVC